MSQYRYYIQIGNHPHISFFSASAPIFPTSDAASVAAFDYLVRKGYKPTEISTKWIHTRKERLARKVHKVRKHTAGVFVERVRRHLELTGKPRDRARDTMPATMCGKKRQYFAMFTGYFDPHGTYKRVWDDAVMPYLGGLS